LRQLLDGNVNHKPEENVNHTPARFVASQQSHLNCRIHLHLQRLNSGQRAYSRAVTLAKGLLRPDTEISGVV
jgi:hypothetical protein